MRLVDQSCCVKQFNKFYAVLTHKVRRFFFCVKALLLAHICFFCDCHYDILSDACIHCSEASTQKNRGSKLAAGTGQRATVQTLGVTEKKGPRARQTTPDKNSNDAQQETYRVCRLVGAILNVL